MRRFTGMSMQTIGMEVICTSICVARNHAVSDMQVGKNGET
ncbi:MAG: hypothetical protein Q7J20_03060 [Candidatus Nitrotoga sp.]|nr:hypothetical protein [Candidatus Nitrotoga sp.]MDO9446879.1 hypothetical protein [Candidatus Nitrotoga sp.]MDP3498360.1 hypothetical protein [Candidatus Nitrotoga sp.]